jgi:hypothetical protein
VGVVGVVGVVDPCAPTLAVTVADVDVCRLICAVPVESVGTCDGLRKFPAVVEKVTGTVVSGLPLTSSTLAAIVETPPGASVTGLALTFTRPTPAEPTRIVTAPFAPTDEPPEIALMLAVPDRAPAENVALAMPLESVSASDG